AENYISVLESSITEMKKTGNRPGYTVLPKLTFQTFSEKFENDLIEYKAELIKMESEFVDENKVSLHSMLWEGINTSNPKLVKKAIKLGVDIDSKQCGSTPLHAAVQKDSYEIVKILLENKADHTIPHHGNTSILGYAKAIGRKKIATLLEKYGAK
ncbi:MAG: ankyrin repeat domain-containing protein, partial [Leptospiraceae bacterium]|nr:ankyrin repeat domain-containing protein [Leptospiraceae bacterium]